MEQAGSRGPCPTAHRVPRARAVGCPSRAGWGWGCRVSRERGRQQTKPRTPWRATAAPPRLAGHCAPSAVPQGEGCEGPGRQLAALTPPTFPLPITPLSGDAVVILGPQTRPWGLAQGTGTQQNQESEWGGGPKPSHTAGSQDRAWASAQSRLGGSALPLAGCVTWDDVTQNETLKAQASAFSAVTWGQWPASQGADGSHRARLPGRRAAPGAAAAQERVARQNHHAGPTWAQWPSAQHSGSSWVWAECTSSTRVSPVGPPCRPQGVAWGGCVQLHRMETIVGYTGRRSGETQRSHPHFLHRCRVREMSEVGDEARHRWTGSGSQQLLGRRGCRHTPTPGCETQLGHLRHRANGRSGEDALPCGCLGVPGLLSAPR